uniref:Delta(3,5)-Delta(2,4)-dienoyl-CoA isomerase, mitochondrial n=1 Tax=Strigamia maritima TaxID=126957 RepID=T1JKI9_STRMM
MSKLTSVHSGDADIARKARFMKKLVSDYQSSFTAIENCNKPVIAAIHGACIGGGVDMVTACDIRYCTQDAWFQIKEVDIGLAADVGTLQRLPKIVGNDGLVRELSYTARKFYANEAAQIGMVNRILPSKEDLLLCAFETAILIASKSPVAVQGTKIHLNYSRDHTVQEGLDYMANWNMTHLLSEDLMKAAMAAATKANDPPIFAKY